MVIRLDTVEKVTEFVNSIEELPVEMDLICGRTEVDAKSLLGVFSLDLTRPLTVRLPESSEQSEEIHRLLDRFV